MHIVLFDVDAEIDSIVFYVMCRILQRMVKM